MHDDAMLTLPTTPVSGDGLGDSTNFPQHPHAHHSPLTDEEGEEGDAQHEPLSAAQHTRPQNVLTNNKSPTEGSTSFTQQQQQQQQRLSNEEAAAINATIMRAISSEDMLENFLRKYPRATPGSGVGVGPIKSTTQGVDRHGQPRPPDYHVKRAAKLREKRRHLRALQEIEFHDAITPPRRANSAAVGLMSFGMTFILFGLHYTGHFMLDTVVPAMAINYGGGVQLIAGLLSWVQGQTFAYVSFVSYGGFFLALTCLWMLPNASFKPTEEVQSPSDYFIGAFYSIWGVFSCIMVFCTPRMNLCIFLKVLTTTLCLLCLAGGLMAGNTTATHVGGYFGIISGAVSMYLCFASLINEVWDCDIVPVFQTTHLLEGKVIWQRKSAATGTQHNAEEEETEKITAKGSDGNMLEAGDERAKGPAVAPAA